MNIFEIQDELRLIFDELEENGGELTPELEEKLNITEDEFKTKIEAYTNIIKEYNADMSLIKEEQARLKTLYECKEKTVDKLKSILVQAVNNFGETKKTGVKYFDYGTGSISIRKTTAVQTNDDLIKFIGENLSSSIFYSKVINTLNTTSNIDLDLIADSIKEQTAAEIDGEELEYMDMNISFNIPLKDLQSGVGYTALKEAIKYSDGCKMTTSISKSNMKDKLKENGAITPNLAKLVVNESLQIK